MPYQSVVVAVVVVAAATILYFLTKGEPAYSYGGNNRRPPPSNTSIKDWERCDDKFRHKHSKMTCTICLDELLEGIRTLPCEHKFHKECINKWLSQKGNENQGCPLCRKRVFL